MIGAEIVKLTEEQLKMAESYALGKAKDPREQTVEKIGKKGEFVAYNFLKDKLRIKCSSQTRC